MAKEGFVAELRLTPVRWRLYDGYAIRCGFAGNYHCPITAVCKRITNQAFDTNAWSKAADAIGLSDDDARAIMNAADANISTSYDLDLRQALLAATGLA